MAGNWWPYWKKFKPAARLPPGPKFFLDAFTAEDIERWGERGDEVREYYRKFHGRIDAQRRNLGERLQSALAKEGRPFIFKSWTRVVDHRWALNPLSARGSVLNSPGGRFNFGVIQEDVYPPFHALYVAEDFQTAYAEKFALAHGEKRGELSVNDLSLSKGKSFVSVAVRGSLERVLDISTDGALLEFAEILREISYPEDLRAEAEHLRLPEQTMINSVEILRTALLDPNWRARPMQVDIPSPSQEFGQVAWQAGLQAIRFKSQRGGKDCLAIFPSNLVGCAESYIELEDKPPPECKLTKLHADSWKDAT